MLGRRDPPLTAPLLMEVVGPAASVIAGPTEAEVPERHGSGGDLRLFWRRRSVGGHLAMSLPMCSCSTGTFDVAGELAGLLTCT